MSQCSYTCSAAEIGFTYISSFLCRSDVLGQLLPMVGKDWSQSGVTELFTKIAKNGYRFAYLSSRAIGQAQITRDFLRSVKQGACSLPDGPLFLNPSSLINAFHKYVISPCLMISDSCMPSMIKSKLVI